MHLFCSFFDLSLNIYWRSGTDMAMKGYRYLFNGFTDSVVDPDVFGPPESGSVIILYGSGSFYQQKSKKNLAFTSFVISF
jgi:hypothetical protein